MSTNSEPGGDSLSVRAASDTHDLPASKPFLTTYGLVIGLGCLTIAIVGLLLGMRLLVGDNIPVMTRDALDAAVEQWQATGPASYDLDVQIGGAQPGKVHVEVRDGKVTVATRDGLPTPAWNKDEWTVPGQFEMLEREFEFAENPQREMQAPPGSQLWLHAEFNREFGYPQRYHRYVAGGAPEVFWHTALTPK